MGSRQGPVTLEWPKDRKLSGNAYVAARFEGKLEKIRLLNEVSCDHVANICSACAYMWEQDYEILYDNTAGGRRLKALRSN